MLAEDNKTLQETANCIYEANADEIIRQRCFYREEAERHERTIKRDMKALKEKINILEEEKASLKEEKVALLEKIKMLEKQVKS